MKWILKKFEELSVHELYTILRLRNEVFVVEQHCVYQDLDNKDQESWHLVCLMDAEAIAYTRLMPPGTTHHEASIGRVVTSPVHRRTGLGKELMQRSLEHCEALFGKETIVLGAQVYLMDFYRSFDFIPEGNIYLEDGIEHIVMKRNVST